MTGLQVALQAGSSDQILSSLSQANATIFALAFTIPIVAAQLSRYLSVKRLLKKWSISYMVLYLITVFVPLVVSQGNALQVSTVFFLSSFCGGLVIYYFAYVEAQLTPYQQLEDAARSIASPNNGWVTAKSQMLYIVSQALQNKDYEVYHRGLKKFSDLIDFIFRCQETDAKMRVTSDLEEIGSQALPDYAGLRYFCEELKNLAEKSWNLKNQYSRDLAISSKIRTLILLTKAKPVGMYPLKTLLEVYILDQVNGDDHTRRYLQTIKDEITDLFLAKYISSQDLNRIFETLEVEYKIAHMRQNLELLESLRRIAFPKEHKSYK